MSTVKRRPPAPPAIPPLVDGQRLGQTEFMRRYELTPPRFKAELIGGVVHVPCPLGREHGGSSIDTGAWLVHYRARTPGIEALADATTLMDDLGVPQPDAQLRIRPECGGQSRDEGKYVGGAPNWWLRSHGPPGRLTLAPSETITNARASRNTSS